MFDTSKVDRQIELFIFDIYIAILKIKKVASEFNNPQDLKYDFIKWDSVIREFEIIGEATKYLLRDELLKKEYRQIVNFRNKITHEYFGIDEEEIWNVICEHLNSFEEVILELIHSLENSLKKELIESFIEDNKYLDFVVKALEELR